MRKSLQVFREPIDFSVEACVPIHKPFHTTIEERIQVRYHLLRGTNVFLTLLPFSQANSEFIYGEEELGIVQRVREVVQKKKRKITKLPADAAEEALERHRKEKAKRKRLLNSSGHFFDAEKVQEQEQEREQQQEQEVHPLCSSLDCKQANS